MKTNLLLLDSYNKIEDLVAYAFSFSNRTKRNLEIVYVFDFDWMRQSYLVDTPGLVNTVEPANNTLVAVEQNVRKEFDVAETKIREVAANYIKKHAAKVPYEIKVSETNRLDTVNDIHDKTSDLIVLVSNHQSYTEVSDGLIGFPNIVEHVECPVLVIPENLRLAVIKDVVYTSDIHNQDLDVLKKLVGLLHYSKGINLTVLHNEKKYDFEKKLKWLGFSALIESELGVKDFNFILKSEKSLVQAIEEYINGSNPDLLVLLKEKKGFFKELFSSSETKNVLTHIHSPVLVYHET